MPHSQGLNDALGVLEGVAQIEGPLCEVHVRVAEHKGAIFIDLGRERWESVRVDQSGWRIVSDPPVRFVRPPAMLPLPVPVRGGSLDELRPFINMSRRADWVLFLAWLVAALRPDRPFPVLIITGEQGTAKSTAVRIARLLIDPSKRRVRNKHGVSGASFREPHRF